MVNQFGVLILLVVLAWIGQLALSLLQTRRFYRRVAQLRRGSYASAVGLAGSNWKRKVYALLVVDQALTITSAQRLSGFTVFASLRPVAALEGLPLSRIEEDTPVAGISKKQWSAFQNAAGYIRSHQDSHESGEDEAGAVADAGEEALGRG